MDRKRFDEVDFLRAFGIIGVILIHILTYNQSSPIDKFLWNNLQFVVISFVFASGFVLAYFYENAFTSISQTLSWYKKRFIRLLVPFYLYLTLHNVLWLAFPDIFSGLGLSKSMDYFVQSTLLFGGTNYNFLVVLFIELTLLFPIFTVFFKRKKILFLYIFFSSLVTLIFTFFGSPYSLYRFTMWIPWSLILIFAMYISVRSKMDKNAIDTDKRYLIFGILFFILFAGFYVLNQISGKSLNFYNHKYPPDFYYVFFGLSITCFALLIGKLKFWQNKILKDMYLFISKNSYSIFFIHYIILDAVLVLASKNLFFKNSFVQFLIIFFPTIFIILILNRIKLIKKFIS